MRRLRPLSSRRLNWGRAVPRQSGPVERGNKKSVRFVFVSNSATFGSAPQVRLLIVDGHSYAYRAFYAIRQLSSPTGRPTNAIYGFIRMLGKVQEVIHPTHVVVIWDGGLAQERIELLPEYKAQRVKMPSDMEEQLDGIVAYLGAARIGSWMKEGVEADDCIAGLTRRAVEGALEVVIASSDKDFMQLVGPQTQIVSPGDKALMLVGPEEVRRKTGVEPGQIVDWLSLVGDSVDNIAGVPGIGPKTATFLLKQFGSIDEIYRRLGEVATQRLQSNLQASEQLVRRNQKLVRLNVEAPCELTLEELKVQPGDAGKLQGLFSGWGFRTLLKELEGKPGGTGDLFERQSGEKNG